MTRLSLSTGLKLAPYKVLNSKLQQNIGAQKEPYNRYYQVVEHLSNGLINTVSDRTATELYQ